MAERDKSRQRLDRLFNQIEQRVPAAAGLLRWLRQPGSRWVRIPLGILLVFGGIFSFLPILGIWMLPLGLLLLALDIPFLQGPVNRTIIWGQRKWTTFQRRRRERRAERERERLAREQSGRS
jgi:hypothetical protein